MIDNPIPGPQAFGGSTEGHIHSQAAIILMAGSLLRNDAVNIAGTASEFKREFIPNRDLEEFPAPALQPVSEEEKFSSDEMQAVLRDQYNEMAFLAPEGEGLETLAKNIYSDPSARNAALLFEACLYHPHEILRVCAAASYHSITNSPERMIQILRTGLFSATDIAADIASAALRNIAPLDLITAFMGGSAPPWSIRGPSIKALKFRSLTLHGTWARRAAWWQPGSPFHNYLKGISTNMYDRADAFSWSGSYSDSARRLAAVDLRDWLLLHSISSPSIFAHSHGGNVAMAASNLGLAQEKLVLLSCPVHPQRYYPDFLMVPKVISIRVRLDLVILADRGGQSFNDPLRIKERTLPIWFKHSATHDESVWKRFDVQAML